MTSKQIEIYLEVAKTENLSLAADRLYVSKATMSRQLAALEEETGFQLFAHTGNSIRLTPEGEILKNTFEKMNRTLENGFQRMRDIRDGLHGHLTLGFTSDMCIPDLFLKKIDAFRRKYPDVALSYTAKPQTTYVRDLADGTIDLILAHDMALQKYASLEHLFVTEVRRGLYYGIRHPLARKKDLSIADFANETHWASVHSDTAEQRASLKQLATYYNMPEFQTRYVQTTHEIVFHLLLGEGFSIMDDLILQGKPEDIRVLPADESLEPIRLSIFWDRANANPCIPLFCGMLGSV